MSLQRECCGSVTFGARIQICNTRTSDMRHDVHPLMQCSYSTLCDTRQYINIL